MYKVLNTIIDRLGKQVEELKSDVAELKKSENKWYRKCHALENLIFKNKCPEPCKIHQAYVEYTEKNGEIV